MRPSAVEKYGLGKNSFPPSSAEKVQREDREKSHPTLVSGITAAIRTLAHLSMWAVFTQKNVSHCEPEISCCCGAGFHNSETIIDAISVTLSRQKMRTMGEVVVEIEEN